MTYFLYCTFRLNPKFQDIVELQGVSDLESKVRLEEEEGLPWFVIISTVPLSIFKN